MSPELISSPSALSVQEFSPRPRRGHSFSPDVPSLGLDQLRPGTSPLQKQRPPPGMPAGFLSPGQHPATAGLSRAGLGTPPAPSGPSVSFGPFWGRRRFGVGLPKSAQLVSTGRGWLGTCRPGSQPTRLGPGLSWGQRSVKLLCLRPAVGRCSSDRRDASCSPDPRQAPRDFTL